MKTAVTIPDDMFQEAEELAAALGLSLNDLYIAAVTQFIRERRDQSITERLNQVYEKNDSSLDDVIKKMQAVSLPVEWWRSAAIPHPHTSQRVQLKVGLGLPPLLDWLIGEMLRQPSKTSEFGVLRLVAALVLKAKAVTSYRTPKQKSHF